MPRSGDDLLGGSAARVTLTVVVCLGMLRPFKGLLIALQYRLKAEQGRLDL